MKTVDMAVLSEKLEELSERERRRAELDGPEIDYDPFALRDPLDMSAVDAFESRHGVSLPEDYREFLTTIGDGGAGPPAYGLYGLAVAEDESRKTIYELSDEYIPPSSTDQYVDLEAPGMLLLGHEGCAFYVGLVLTGPEAGSVWSYVEVRPGWVPAYDRSNTLVGPDGEDFVFENGDYGAWYNTMLAPENRHLRMSFSEYYDHWLDGFLGQ